VPEIPLAMVSTVVKAVDGPCFNRSVTPEVAPDQVMLNAEPAVIPAKDGFVI